MAGPTDAVLRHAFLVNFNFLSGSYYVWQGFRPLLLSGQIWQPVGPMATVDTVEDLISDTVPSISLKVSGADAGLLAKALSESNEVRGQMAIIYDIYFDENWQPIGDPESYAMVRMDVMKISKRKNSDGSADQVIEIPSEHLLTNGPNPPAGRYSSADQAQRYPLTTDLYFEFIPQNQNRIQRWPTF
jgi:hypothetical protein